MTVFKTLLKIVASYKGVIIMYTVILLFFGIFNMKTNDSSLDFQSSKPDIYIINNDQEEGITKNLVEYLSENCNIMDIDIEDIDDALFYRDINAIITIPNNYRSDVLEGKNPSIEIETTGDYMSSLATMMLERYTKLLNTYYELDISEKDLTNLLDDTLSSTVETKVTSKVDTDSVTRASYYFSFANYSLLAGCVYVVCLVLLNFKKEAIHKRTVISSMNYKKHNRILLIGNGIFSTALWLLYIILAFILLGDIMFSGYGIIYIINSFIFMLGCLSLAFVIANLISNKDAISGIVNVVALGSSFLCGAFVPCEFLPETVLNIGKIFPSYWYINTNEKLKTLEVFNLESLSPILVNFTVLVIFVIAFTIIANMVSKKKRVVG